MKPSSPWSVLVASLMAQPRKPGTDRQQILKPTKHMRAVIDVMQPGVEYTAGELAAMVGVPMERLKNRLVRMRERGMLHHREFRGRFLYRKDNADESAPGASVTKGKKHGR